MERIFRVVISFDNTEANVFGGVGHQSVVVNVPETVKDEIITEFIQQNSVITVNMSDSSVRYLNARNILCIDVSEIKVEEKDNGKVN